MGLCLGQGWLLARRSIVDPTDLAYYQSNAPRRTSLHTLAEVAGTRWSIETTIEEGKARRVSMNVRSLAGTVSTVMSPYRSWSTRSWRQFGSQWGKNLPDPEMAELSVPVVRRLLEIVLPLPLRSPELRLAWSQWRRARRQ